MMRRDEKSHRLASTRVVDSPWAMPWHLRLPMLRPSTTAVKLHSMLRWSCHPSLVECQDRRRSKRRTHIASSDAHDETYQLNLQLREFVFALRLQFIAADSVVVETDEVAWCVNGFYVDGLSGAEDILHAEFSFGRWLFACRRRYDNDLAVLHRQVVVIIMKEVSTVRPADHQPVSIGKEGTHAADRVAHQFVALLGDDDLD